jgi:hypothetical protein
LNDEVQKNENDRPCTIHGTEDECKQAFGEKIWRIEIIRKT